MTISLVVRVVVSGAAGQSALKYIKRRVVWFCQWHFAKVQVLLIKQVIIQWPKSKSVWEVDRYAECNCLLHFVSTTYLLILKWRVGTFVVKLFDLGAILRSTIPYLPIYYMLSSL